MEESDIRKLIEFLQQRRELLNCTISDLEQLTQTTSFAPKRPGRKSVGAEERALISERMKARWAVRRQGRTVGAGGMS